MSTRSTTHCSIRICSFCNYCHSRSSKSIRNILLCHYATTGTAEQYAPLKKKTKQRSKKYAELLEVTDQAISNRKAAVRKLNSTRISMLVGQPDITLDKLHKISSSYFDKKTHTTQATVDDTKLKNKNKLDDVHYMILKESKNIIEDKSMIVGELQESGISDSTTLIKDSAFVDTLHQIRNNDTDENQDDFDKLPQTSMKQEISEYNKIPFTKEKDPFEIFPSDYNLISQLLACIDVYTQNGMLNKSFKLILSNKKQLNASKIPATAVYNLLMKGYASKSHPERVSEIYDLMVEDHVKMDVETFATMFQVIGNMKSQTKQMEMLTKVIKDMTRYKVFFSDILNTSQMKPAHREAILRCIRLASPEYNATYPSFDNSYKCKLLQNLKVGHNYHSPTKGIVSLNELRQVVQTQIDAEMQQELKVENIAKFTGDVSVKQQAVERIAEWEKSWKLAVVEAFEKNLSHLKQKEMRIIHDLSTLYPFLQVLPQEAYVDAIMREIRRLARSSEAFNFSMSFVYLTLGKYIYKKYEFHKMKETKLTDNITKIYDKYLEWYTQQDSTDVNVNGRIKWQQLTQEVMKTGLHSDITIPMWPRHILINVGKFLYNIIVNNVKIPYRTKPGAPERLIPAFYLLFRNQHSYLTEQIKPHPHLYRVFSESHPEILTFETVLLPMLIPPRPWINVNTGGYLFSKADFVRDSCIEMSSMYLMKNTPTEQLYPALDSLNQLGSIPWRINQPVLDILIQIFREGGSEELNVPQPSSSLLPLSEQLKNLTEQNNKSKISMLMIQHKRKKNEMFSLWCDCLYKLCLANHFRDQVFWLPHNLDFRGRAYPVPPHLTHLTSDLGRSFLIFAQKKPLGPKGLDWLKIHAINLTGMKKREPIDKRLEFANEVLDLIIDSARNPLKGKKWWMKSDEPWQTLATCKEIDKALQCPNPEEYLTGFPIHQDGTCNGLQHYAALGRDQIGAESVNLYPASTPQDVYSVVVAMVDEFRKRDAENGLEIAQVLEGHISRKVIKQTVMTTVYGVTKFGARLQITRQLSDIKEFPQEHIWSGSLYLVQQTFKSLQTMFTSAKEIQDWFTDCARIISTQCNQYVQWVTPLGLPVLQPYNKHIKRNANTNTKGLKKPDTMKQKNAFPPNFIHSLDSCHMMLTSLHCEQAGITFMSVHDCFWTHPQSVEIMSKICREQFVALHCEPILEDLSEFFCNRYMKCFINDRKQKEDFSPEIFRKLPKKGNFDINKVLSSPYFFS
ncbi:DNA-directed RNA polymerase, mitochondrial isoform X2 [Odontomachus brunneus]|nr:DNA-directed RNA polymerase, mitochondrial isoform X2 [Odontomachus brunneus]XP_032688018.1 DNA-directed RNA polymerase, mitochondrial isoform X2 [Odontomachus brunneus]